MPCYQLILKKFKPTAPARQTPLQVLKGDDVEKYSCIQLHNHLGQNAEASGLRACDETHHQSHGALLAWRLEFLVCVHFHFCGLLYGASTGVR